MAVLVDGRIGTGNEDYHISVEIQLSTNIIRAPIVQLLSYSPARLLYIGCCPISRNNVGISRRPPGPDAQQSGGHAP
jgi:hypothetical protein